MKISLAELEYRIEKDQIDIINLSQKIQSLRMANEKDSLVEDLGKEECLYKYITKYEITFLVAADLESARYVPSFLSLSLLPCWFSYKRKDITILHKVDENFSRLALNQTNANSQFRAWIQAVSEVNSLDMSLLYTIG